MRASRAKAMATLLVLVFSVAYVLQTRSLLAVTNAAGDESSSRMQSHFLLWADEDDANARGPKPGFSEHRPVIPVASVTDNGIVTSTNSSNPVHVTQQQHLKDLISVGSKVWSWTTSTTTENSAGHQAFSHGSNLEETLSEPCSGVWTPCDAKSGLCCSDSTPADSNSKSNETSRALVDGTSADAPDEPAYSSEAARECGLPSSSDSGADADADRLPWMVAISKRGRIGVRGRRVKDFLCAGALVSSKVVVATAGCVGDYASAEKLMLLKVNVAPGTHAAHAVTNNDPAYDGSHDVSRVVVHPRFKRNSETNDVAVVVLSAPVMVRSAVCLPGGDYLTTGDGGRAFCEMASWQAEEDRGGVKRLSGESKHREVSLISREECETELELVVPNSDGASKLDASLTCGRSANGWDGCQGLEGSPLICQSHGSGVKSGKQSVLVGLFAWNRVCGKAWPVRFVSVPRFSSWISSLIRAHDPNYAGLLYPS